MTWLALLALAGVAGGGWYGFREQPPTSLASKVTPPSAPQPQATATSKVAAPPPAATLPKDSVPARTETQAKSVSALKSDPAATPAKPTVPLDAYQSRLSAATKLSPQAIEVRYRLYDDAGLHKAQAIAPGTQMTWYVATWNTPEIAAERALEGCQVRTGMPCMLIAVNDRIEPPADPAAWPVRDMPRVAYSGLFDPERLPSSSQATRRNPQSQAYRPSAAPKAAAFHPTGRLFTMTAAASQAEAETQALAACNADPDRRGRDGPCYLYAVGDQVVLPKRSLVPLTAP